jgi:hypothetical protein
LRFAGARLFIIFVLVALQLAQKEDTRHISILHQY